MENLIILIVCLLAGISTYHISCTLGKGPVVASAVVTLLSGLIFPFLFPTIGGVLAAAGACASYTGMVDIQKVCSLKEMAGVSLITGSIFIIATSAYSGIGGRLGTISAIACFVWIGIKILFSKYKSAL